jgi:hypothetical protein
MSTRRKCWQNTGPMLPGCEISASAENTTLHPLTSSVVASLASPIALQGSDRQAATNATCGASSTGLFASLDPRGLWLRTYQDCYQAKMDGSLDEYSGTWPRRGTMQSGKLYAPVTSAPRTNANGFSLWPTPRANKVDGYSSEGYSPTLGMIARMWPTPLSSDSEHGGPNCRDSAGRYNLTGMVHHATWPTPQARDYRSGDMPDSLRAIRKQAQGWTPNLNDVVNWNTPTAQDSKNDTLPPSQANRDSLVGQLIQQQVQGRLNPEFVEVLMGFPVGWTDIDGPPDPENGNTRGNRLESSQKR